METEFYFDDCFAMLDATPVTIELIHIPALVIIQPLSPDDDLITITFDIQPFIPYLSTFTDLLA